MTVVNVVNVAAIGRDDAKRPREHFFPQFPVIREKNREMFKFCHLNFSKRHKSAELKSF